METILATAFETLKATAGVSVTYRRGIESFEVVAVVGKTELEEDRGSAIVKYEARDYLILTADLEGWIPQKGDLIEEDGSEHVVLVIAGQAAWRYADQLRVVLRVHTKQ